MVDGGLVGETANDHGTDFPSVLCQVFRRTAWSIRGHKLRVRCRDRPPSFVRSVGFRTCVQNGVYGGITVTMSQPATMRAPPLPAAVAAKVASPTLGAPSVIKAIGRRREAISVAAATPTR